MRDNLVRLIHDSDNMLIGSSLDITSKDIAAVKEWFNRWSNLQNPSIFQALAALQWFYHNDFFLGSDEQSVVTALSFGINSTEVIQCAEAAKMLILDTLDE
jgi:hypothetical protein